VLVLVAAISEAATEVFVTACDVLVAVAATVGSVTVSVEMDSVMAVGIFVLNVDGVLALVAEDIVATVDVSVAILLVGEHSESRVYQKLLGFISGTSV
jgi:hypothetical protein